MKDNTKVIKMSNEKNNVKNELIQIRVLPSTQWVLNGITNKLYVMIEISTSMDEKNKKTRTPLDLALVLDRSGSMSGEKITNSKLAVIKVIENLHPDDILHFVMYDDVVDVVFKNGSLKNKQILIEQVKTIRARNSTNLAGGLTKGYEMFDTKNKDKSSKSQRIFLFSDGLANEGIRSPDKIKELASQMHKTGVNISAFGIGRDFNEDLMMGIAEHGAGDYFFIDGADNIPSIVNEGLEGLLGIVASNSVLKVNGINGSTVTKIYSYDLMIGATLGDIRELETRQVLVEIEVQPEKLNDSMEFMKYEFGYNPIANLLEKNIISSSISIKRTDDDSKIQEENDEVLVLRNLLETAEQEMKMHEMIDSGRIDEAIDLQSSLIIKLGKILNRDTKGLVDMKIETSKDVLERLKEDEKMGEYSMSRKMSHYSSYQTRSSKFRQRRKK